MEITDASAQVEPAGHGLWILEEYRHNHENGAAAAENRGQSRGASCFRGRATRPGDDECAHARDRPFGHLCDSPDEIPPARRTGYPHARQRSISCPGTQAPLHTLSQPPSRRPRKASRRPRRWEASGHHLQPPQLPQPLKPPPPPPTTFVEHPLLASSQLRRCSNIPAVERSP